MIKLLLPLNLLLLIGMFHSRKLNSRVIKLHERTLRIVYQDYASSFTEHLEKDNSTTIHNINIQLNLREIMLKRCITELKLYFS